MNLNITTHPHCYLIEIDGRIDSYTAPKIEAVLNDLFNKKPMNVVIDLEKTIYLSSSGILLFVKTQERFTTMGKGEIVFCSVPKLIYFSFSLSGFYKLFTFCKNPTLAMESL